MFICSHCNKPILGLTKVVNGFSLVHFECEAPFKKALVDEQKITNWDDAKLSYNRKPAIGDLLGCCKAQEV